MPDHSRRTQGFLIEAFDKLPISQTMGLNLAYSDDGEACVSMPTNPAYYQSFGDTHGGVYATLLDSAAIFTVIFQTGRLALTTDLHTRLLSPAKNRNLMAKGRVLRAGQKTATCDIRLEAEDGDLIATGSAGFKLLDAFQIPLKT